MDFQDYTQKNLDNEELRKQEEANWIANFRQTALYRQLLEEFDPESVEKNLGYLAQQRTQIYELGPYRLKEEKAKHSSLIPFVLRFFRAVQVKKLFDMEVQWNAGSLDLRVRSVNHFEYLRERAWTLSDLPPVNDNDLAFIRSLLSDEEYLVSTLEVEEGYFWPEEHILKWYASWDPAKPPGENYPVLFRKYDVWNHQEWLPQLPPTKYLQRLKEEEKNKTWTDPEAGKEFMPWDVMLDWTKKWFREREPREMQRWFEAWSEAERPKASFSMEFLHAVEFLLDQPFRHYPPGNLRWDLAIVATARKIIFENVAFCLDEAFDFYKDGIAHSKNPLDQLEGD